MHAGKGCGSTSFSRASPELPQAVQDKAQYKRGTVVSSKVHRIRGVRKPGKGGSPLHTPSPAAESARPTGGRCLEQWSRESCSPTSHRIISNTCKPGWLRRSHSVSVQSHQAMHSNDCEQHHQPCSPPHHMLCCVQWRRCVAGQQCHRWTAKNARGEKEQVQGKGGARRTIWTCRQPAGH